MARRTTERKSWGARTIPVVPTLEARPPLGEPGGPGRLAQRAVADRWGRLGSLAPLPRWPGPEGSGLAQAASAALGAARAGGASSPPTSSQIRRSFVSGMKSQPTTAVITATAIA
jgi:hypothetical protein